MLRDTRGLAALFALSLVACDAEMPSLDAAVADAGAPMDAANDASAVPGADAGPVPADAGGSDAGGSDAAPPLPDTGPPTCDDPATWYRDLDDDNHGDPASSVESCDPVAGFVSVGDDCDDACPTCFPGSVEACGAGDEDCDGRVDETQVCTAGVTVGCTTTCGTEGVGACTAACGLPDPASCVPPAEICNGADDDCDGEADDGFTCAAGASAACTTTCGTTGTGTCTASCEPAAAAACAPPVEVCNSVDDDCDGRVDETFSCAQGDSVSCRATCGTLGTGTCTATCDFPSGAACSPPAEVCNGADDDCDGDRDETFACVRNGTASCTTSCGSAGTRSCSSSCTPFGACAPPSESCSYADDDCDGRIDERGLRRLGSETRTGELYAVRRPRIASTTLGHYGVFQAASRNILYFFGDDGTPNGGRIDLGPANDFDVAGSASSAYYAVIDSSAAMQVHRIEENPTAADPYRWSRTISGAFREVHLAPIGSVVWVYARRTDGRLVRFELDTTSGTVASPTGLQPHSTALDRPFAVASNGYRHHWLAHYDTVTDRIWVRHFDMDEQELVRIITPVGSSDVRDISITGVYFDSTRVDGFVLTYATPTAIRYYYLDAAGNTHDELVSSSTIASRADGYSQIDSMMRDGVGYAAFVDSSNRTRLYSYTRTTTSSADLFVSSISTTAISARAQQGAALAVPSLQPRSGVDPAAWDRIFYDPGTGAGSRPLSCL